MDTDSRPGMPLLKALPPITVSCEIYGQGWKGGRRGKEQREDHKWKMIGKGNRNRATRGGGMGGRGIFFITCPSVEKVLHILPVQQSHQMLE